MADLAISAQAYTDARIAAVYRYIDKLDEKNTAAVKLEAAALSERTKVALDAVTEHNVKNNGLIEMMRKMMLDFVSWRTLFAGLGGAGIAVGIYKAVTGT